MLPKLRHISAVWLALLFSALPAQQPSRDAAFLEDLSRRSFRYFEEQTDAHTGLVRDRARTDGSPHGERQDKIASIAATGFGLSAWCIAAERGWVTKERARDRILATLHFFADQQEHKEGWFYHFVNYATGEREWKSEISSIDTTWLLAGVLTAHGYFRNDVEIERLAQKIYRRVNFQWMLNGDPHLLSHGWKPESGFIVHRWNHYSEIALIYLLAIGSPTHPIKPESWYAWKRELDHLWRIQVFERSGAALYPSVLARVD